MVIFLSLLLLLFVLRTSILQAAAAFLARTDPPIKADAAFVLSGAAMERTLRALELYPEYVPEVITTGEMISQALLALGHQYTGAEVMRDALLSGGVDSADVHILPKGTSTFEESEEILGYCLAQGFKRIMIISSLHHTRRIHGVFREKFRDAGIEIIIIGAAPLTYSPDQWWQQEDGLIMVTNEYLKLVYYWWRY